MDEIQSRSDINWSSGERPTISILAAACGAAVGYVSGLEALTWQAGGRWIPLPKIPALVWSLIKTHDLISAAPGGWFPPLCAIASGLIGAGVGWTIATRANVRHLHGLHIYEDPRVAAKSFRPLLGGPGVRVHPQVQIGMAAECAHFLILGGPGSGKTTTLWTMLQDITARGDRALILDFKGDFTRDLPKPITLLAPADARGVRWALGQDIRTRLDASALAETLIPLGAGEPIWAQGARGLLVGLLSHLQTTRGTSWGFQEIAELAARVLVDYKLLVSIIIKEHPPAKAFLMGADSKTTASFLGQLSGALTHVIELGVSDFAIPKDKGGWSVQWWLRGGYKGPKVAVLGWQPSSKELSQAFAASLIEQVVRQLSDLPDCSPSDRRVWLILDEAAQLGKVPSISDALVTLRSKGVRVVLGLQSIAQIEQSYDRQTLSIWSGATDTKILCRLKSKEDQRFASELLGKRTVERYSHTISQQSAGAGPTRSGSWHRADEPVMPEADFGHKLGPTKGGVRALVFAGGASGAALLDWPFHQSPSPQVRAPRVQARWVLPGFKRPRWGETPPPVADVPDDGESDRKPAPDKTQAPAPDAAAQTQEKEGAGQRKTTTQTQTAPAGKRSIEKDASDPQSDPLDTVATAAVDTFAPGLGTALDIAGKIGNGRRASPGPTLIPQDEPPPAQQEDEMG